MEFDGSGCGSASGQPRIRYPGNIGSRERYLSGSAQGALLAAVGQCQETQDGNQEFDKLVHG